MLSSVLQRGQADSGLGFLQLGEEQPFEGSAVDGLLSLVGRGFFSVSVLFTVETCSALGSGFSITGALVSFSQVEPLQVLAVLWIAGWPLRSRWL